MTLKKWDINDFLDDLISDPNVQKAWELNPDSLAVKYHLTKAQFDALMEGSVDSLIEEGLAERHVHQMRVSW